MVKGDALWRPRSRICTSARNATLPANAAGARGATHPGTIRPRLWGLKLAERVGKNGKKQAIIATARKLAILLHRLWVRGEIYEPFRNSSSMTVPAVT